MNILLASGGELDTATVLRVLLLKRAKFLGAATGLQKENPGLAAPDFQSTCSGKVVLNDHRVTCRLQGDCNYDPLETAVVIIGGG